VEFKVAILQQQPGRPAPTRLRLKWSRGVAEGWIYGEAPRLKQPFWDVDTVPVLPAPGTQFRRRGIHLCRKLQLPDPQFELSSERRGGRDGNVPNWDFRVCES
jgi:hypothetical protein